MTNENFMLIKLAAAIGLYFAKVDNDFDEREKEFVLKYLENLKQSNPISFEEEMEIQKLSEHQITFEEIIFWTNELLDEYVEEERYPLLNTFSVMINQVINADGKTTKEESEKFALWKKTFGIK